MMPIGTPVLSTRGGEVVLLDDSHENGTGVRTDDNFLRIRHDDGSFATYTHIDTGSARVRVGDVVMQSDWIASSGNAGATGGVPHLHFQVSPCEQRSVCGTLPVTFRNTDPNPEGLKAGRDYPARP